MNWLTISEIEALNEEVPLIDNYQDPHSIENTGEQHWDIKVPLRFSGGVKPGKYQEEIEIRPGQLQILATKEQINTYDFGEGQTVRIMGFVYLPHSFVTSGLLPCFQGLVDTNYNHDHLNIVLYNCSRQTIKIKQGERIAYVLFSYVKTDSILRTGDYFEESGIGPPDKNKTPESREGTSKIEEKVAELADRIEQVDDKVESIMFTEPDQE